eukprot:Sdes_comp10806_c0_seq1m2469
MTIVKFSIEVPSAAPELKALLSEQLLHNAPAHRNSQTILETPAIKEESGSDTLPPLDEKASLEAERIAVVTSIEKIREAITGLESKVSQLSEEKHKCFNNLKRVLGETERAASSTISSEKRNSIENEPNPFRGFEREPTANTPTSQYYYSAPYEPPTYSLSSSSSFVSPPKHPTFSPHSPSHMQYKKPKLSSSGNFSHSNVSQYPTSGYRPRANLRGNLSSSSGFKNLRGNSSYRGLHPAADSRLPSEDSSKYRW